MKKFGFVAAGIAPVEGSCMPMRLNLNELIYISCGCQFWRILSLQGRGQTHDHKVLVDLWLSSWKFEG